MSQLRLPFQRLARVCPAASLLAFSCSGPTAQPAPVEPLGEARASLVSSWAPAESMLSPRSRHTATLLLDGKVLLVGGAAEDKPNDPNETRMSYASALDQAELYDPINGSFEAVAPLSQPRWGHSATLLRDGRVLVLGGFTAGGPALQGQGPDSPAAFGTALRSAELYDPDARTFTEVAMPRRARAFHTATLLPNGDVLLVGGTDDVDTLAAVDELEAYRVSRNRFESLGTAQNVAFPHAAVLMEDGRVALAWPKERVQIEVLDPDTGDLVEGASVQCPYQCGAQLLAYRDPWVSSSLALLGSGWSASVDPLPALPALAAPNGAYYEADLGVPAAVTAVGDQVMILGGHRVSYREPTSYSYEDDDLFGRDWATATALPSGETFIAGGAANGALASTVRRHETLVNTDGGILWNLSYSEQYASALLNDGRVLFTGGVPLNDLGQDPLEALVWDGDPSSVQTATMTSIATLEVERWGHQAITLPNGKVLLAGGDSFPAEANEELFDPVTGTSQDLGFRLTNRGNFVLASRGRLVFSGTSGVSVLEPTETGPGQEKRAGFSVRNISIKAGPDCPAPPLARLADGRIAYAGRHALFEVDLEQGRLLDLGEPDNAGCDASLTALPDGTLLIAGGTDDNGEPRLDATIFDPVAREVVRLLPSPGSRATGKSLVRFGEVLFPAPPPDLDSPSPQRVPLVYDWQRGEFRDANIELYPLYSGSSASAAAVTQLASGGLLVVDRGGPNLLDRLGRDAGPAPTRKPAIEVTVGSTVQLTGLPFSTVWPERSSGTTASSSGNHPIPVWIPVIGGWPAVGEFTAWSESEATWRVPNTPFPGLGVLTFARSGILYPLAMAVIEALPLGASCQSGGSCESGYCADGVCCQEICDGHCLACAAALQEGEGVDGACSPALAGTEDAECLPVEECGLTGVCSGQGSCEVVAEGSACAENAVCNSAGQCVYQEPPKGATCEDDVSVTPGGGAKPCAPFRCAAGLCLAECKTNADCVDGTLCRADGACEVVEATRPRKSLGCAPGCYVARSPRADWALWGAALLGGVLLRRRRAIRMQSARRWRS